MNRAMSLAPFKPIIDRQFEFRDARAAYDCLASRAHFGKIVIRVA
jgi:NADPH:quinone reductase-like Zn-dependent oxidoreductase